MRTRLIGRTAAREMAATRRTAISGLDADPAASALVGDSLTDIEAAHRAKVASIGYANKPGKHERMTQAQAEAVITSMADLTLWLRARHL